jgi:hypothetical protein
MSSKNEIKNFIFAEESFDSYMILENEVNLRSDLLSHVRLLTVDNPLIIGDQVAIKILVSSADVLHS